MILGVMATINSSIDFTTAELIASELGVKLEQKIEKIVQKFLEMKKMHYSPRWEVVHLMYFYIL